MFDSPVNPETYDVAVIGGGPAGLATATELKRAGIERVVVLEREPHAGGIPRHCGHPPFGMREFRRILTGPAYAARLVTRAQTAGVEIRLLTTVVEARPGGALLITSPKGIGKISATRVIYATGVRETPRAAQLISGARVQGIMNTGALQSMVYLKNRRPFRRPVIVGSELVAFSALMTSRHAGIRPVAMIEANARATARWPCALFPPLTGTKLHTNTRLLDIQGVTSVTGATVEDVEGQTRSIACDGVVLSGNFTPESTLARSGHIEVDPATGGPVVDQWGRCSDPSYFATGNLLRPVETAGWSWNEGRKTGGWVARDLAGGLPVHPPELCLEIRDTNIKYAMPQRIVLPVDGTGLPAVQLRVIKEVRGDLVVCHSGSVIWSQKIHALPERRISIPLSKILSNGMNGVVELAIKSTPD